jgi:integrase
MTLRVAVGEYVALKQALGADFRSAEKILRRFTRHLRDTPVAAISTADCEAFTWESPAPSSSGRGKQSVLRGFFRYLVGRGVIATSPVEAARSRRVPASAFRHHIYTLDELRRLLEVTSAVFVRRSRLEPVTLRTIVLLLYGAGLRIGEALRLQCSDVDLHERVLLVRHTKFFKSRLVPIGSQLAGVLAGYDAAQRRRASRGTVEAPFFTFRNGTAVSYAAMRAAFARMRHLAGVAADREAGGRPRLHDLRATFAVHRLLAWYREGVDLQVCLPLLATYLGHTELSGTQVYLDTIPELNAEACRRFEHYAFPGKETCHA